MTRYELVGQLFSYFYNHLRTPVSLFWGNVRQTQLIYKLTRGQNSRSVLFFPPTDLVQLQLQLDPFLLRIEDLSKQLIIIISSFNKRHHGTPRILGSSRLRKVLGCPSQSKKAFTERRASDVALRSRHQKRPWASRLTTPRETLCLGTEVLAVLSGFWRRPLQTGRNSAACSYGG